jgi:predicted nucleic acid-binding protein
MIPLFVDSFYYFAILNSKDVAHSRAIEFSSRHRSPLLTTAWVLTEVADGLARSVRRDVFKRLVSSFRRVGTNQIVPTTDELFEKGIELYGERRDKQWSLTDCISFVVMKENGLQDALTGDHHYEQAGFTALLK